MISRDIGGETVTLKKLDPKTLELARRQRTVHVGQVRPTLEFEFLTRPSGEDFDPSLLFEDGDVDMCPTTPPNEFADS